jgi:hypothetical protein
MVMDKCYNLLICKHAVKKLNKHRNYAVNSLYICRISIKSNGKIHLRAQ